MVFDLWCLLNVCSKSPMKLTKKVLDKARYDDVKGGGQYLWDDELTGFGVRINRRGSKSFVVTYRVKRRQRFVTVGRFGMLTLQEARKKAAKFLVAARIGGDPSQDGQVYWRSRTMAKLAERYMNEHAIPKKKPTSVRGDRYLWDCHILPALGKRNMADITRKDVVELHTGMGHIPFAGNRAVRVVRIFRTVGVNF